MKTEDLGSWTDFNGALERLSSVQSQEYRDRVPAKWLFRGQSNSDWGLETTLERHDPQLTGVTDYYRKAFRAKHHIEAITGRKFDIPVPPEYENNLRAPEDPFGLMNDPAYPYLAYLRHHGFPSPLLDWTRSPFIAAFFAFRKSRNPARRVAIYAYTESLTAGKLSGPGEPTIIGRGPFVTTHQRHVMQQCEYTICAVARERTWHYASHLSVFQLTDPLLAMQDVLYKFTLPADCRRPTLDELDRYNLNAYSLFESEEALIETTVNRYW